MASLGHNELTLALFSVSQIWRACSNIKGWIYTFSQCELSSFFCTISQAFANNLLFLSMQTLLFLCFISQAFAKQFHTTPDDLDMHLIYDVSHNIAKIEQHFIDGKEKTLLVHRKGSTRAFPPHHPLIPVDYQVKYRGHLEMVVNNQSSLYTMKLLGGILVSLHPSLRPSVCLASCVPSVAPTVLAGSIHIFTSCQATSEGVSRVMFLAKFWIFGNFLKFVTLTLSCFDLESDVNH